MGENNLPMTHKAYLPYIAIIAVIVLGALAFMSLNKEPQNQKIMEDKTQVEESDESQNPVQDLPDANPFDNKSNPIEDAYKNPFE